MQFSTILASAATLVATVQAADVTVSYMTLEYPGFTQTIPVGLDTSSTQTIDGWTASGTATIFDDVAVIVDATAVYMTDLSPTGGGAQAKGGNGPQNTNVAGHVTVIGGTIQGLSTATATDSSPSSSSTGHSGASRIGGGQAVAMAGLGAAVVAAVI